MLKLDGMSAIVTGGGRGLGRAIALALASEGCNVVICSKNPKELRQTASEVLKLGVECVPVKADVTRKKDILNVVSKTVTKFKRIDVLVNNARMDLMKPLGDTSDREWNRVLNTNLGGMFLFTHAVISHMLHQEGGVIVNVSSAGGKHGFAGMTVYCASKFGVIGFTESLAEEFREDDIRVYAVCPAGIDDRLYHSLRLSGRPRLKAEDVAKKVLYLVSPGCKLPTGSTVDV
jgi:3-oxoacyl-[acyl-carrier protein] reductase